MIEVENQSETQTYSLTEVSQFLDVNESTLRNWEKKFGDFLSNYRNQYNHRLFAQDDIKTLERVKYLMESGMFTVPGVRHMLKTNGGDMTAISVAATQQPTVVQAPAAPNPFDEEYKQKLILALNSLGTEVQSLRREVREDLKGSLKGELDHLKMLLFPPEQPKKPWWKIF